MFTIDQVESAYLYNRCKLEASSEETTPEAILNEQRENMSAADYANAERQFEIGKELLKANHLKLSDRQQTQVTLQHNGSATILVTSGYIGAAQTYRQAWLEKKS
jgi:hypothetical protein